MTPKKVVVGGAETGTFFRLPLKAYGGLKDMRSNDCI